MELAHSILPMWGANNPIKVLPETLYPLATRFATYLIMPLYNLTHPSSSISHSFISSLTYTHALVFSLFITLYVFRFHKLVDNYGIKDNLQNYLYTTIFLLLHFTLVYPTDIGYYLFIERNITCLYNYMIPALLNSMVVMYLLENNLFKVVEKKPKLYICIIGIYFSIFSNLFQSIIVLSLAIVIINKNFISKEKINFIALYVIILWAISAEFEANGMRASAVGSNIPITQLPYGDSLLALFNIVKVMNPLFTIIFVSIIIYVLVKSKDRSDIIELLLALFITCVYLVMLSAKISFAYLNTYGVRFGIFFYILLIVFLCTTRIKLPKYSLHISCVIVSALFLMTFTKYRPYNMVQTEWYKAVAVDEDIVDQFLEADKYELEYFGLKAPKGYMEDNYPHAYYAARRMSQQLYELGIISKYIDVDIVPDDSINKKYSLEY